MNAWRLIETMPCDGTLVLCVVHGNRPGARFLVIAYHDADYMAEPAAGTLRVTERGLDAHSHYATHWMLLPMLP